MTSLNDYRDWGNMPGMICLPAYLHLCESAEALGSALEACFTYLLTIVCESDYRHSCETI